MTTTYRGTIRNGVVVFDGPVPLPEGTPVRVEPTNGQNSSVQTSPASTPHFRPVGAWDGPPGEFDRLLADLQKSRDGDLDVEGIPVTRNRI
jgi:hypothetical protein